MMRRTVTIAAGFLLGVAPASRASQTDAALFAPVSLGGISADMAGLASAAGTSRFRAMGGGFYAHANWVLANTSGACPEQTASPALAGIISVFANAPPPIAEWGVLTGLGAAQLMECNFHAVGLYPKVILSNINFNTANGAMTPYSEWTTMVDAARLHGAVLVAPVCSANYQGDTINWSAGEWTLCKQMAAYGGALAMDTPPTEDIAQGPAYDTFAQQQLAWCRKTGIRCFDILSPFSGGEPNFTHDVLSWLGKIEAGGNKPAAFVVENYNVDSSTNQPTIGTETTTPSLASTALLLARISHVITSGAPATTSPLQPGCAGSSATTSSRERLPAPAPACASTAP